MNNVKSNKVEARGWCKGCDKPIEGDSFVIASLSNGDGVYDVSFFCSKKCLKNIQTVENYYEINDKRGAVSALRQILSEKLRIDDRKYIQCLLLKANREELLTDGYNHRDLIISKDESKEWCYICMDFVDSKIDREHYGYDSYDEGYGFEEAVEERKVEERVVVCRCNKCNTTLLKIAE